MQEIKTKDELRELLKEYGYINCNLNSTHISRICANANCIFENDERKYKFAYKIKLAKKTGNIKFAQILISSNYFKNREFITFNENGFVGFVGWGDDEKFEMVKHVLKSELHEFTTLSNQ